MGVFLNLPREKTVRYFSVSLIPHDIKPKISQTKKNRALYHARSLSYFAREVRTFEKKRRPLYYSKDKKMKNENENENRETRDKRKK